MESDGFIRAPPCGFRHPSTRLLAADPLQTGRRSRRRWSCSMSPGGTFWEGWSRFLSEEVEPGAVAPGTTGRSSRSTDDPWRRPARTARFYRNYRCARVVGDLLVLRMAHPHPTGASSPTSNRRLRRHRGTSGGQSANGTDPDATAMDAGRDDRRGGPPPARPPLDKVPLRAPPPAHRRRQRTRRRVSTGAAGGRDGRRRGGRRGRRGRRQALPRAGRKERLGGRDPGSYPWSARSAVGFPGRTTGPSWRP